MSNKDASVSILLYSREDRISFLNLRAIHKFHDWALEGIEFLMDSYILGFLFPKGMIA